MENGDRIGKVGVYLFSGSKWGHTEMFILPHSELPDFLGFLSGTCLGVEVGIKCHVLSLRAGCGDRGQRRLGSSCLPLSYTKGFAVTVMFDPAVTLRAV